MTIAVVQSIAVPNAFSGSFGANVTAGNAVVISVHSFATSNVAISSSSPTLGGSPVTGTVKLVENPGPFSAGDGVETYGAFWILPNCAGGSAAVAITVTNGLVNTQTGLILWEVSGMGATPTLDQSALGSAQHSTPVASGTTGAILSAPEFILGGATVAQGSAAGPGGWTLLSIGTTSYAGYQIATSSGGTYSWSQTGGAAGPWNAQIATVQPPAPPSVAVPVSGGGKSMLGRSMRWADL